MSFTKFFVAFENDFGPHIGEYRSDLGDLGAVGKRRDAVFKRRHIRLDLIDIRGDTTRNMFRMPQSVL